MQPDQNPQPQPTPEPTIITPAPSTPPADPATTPPPVAPASKKKLPLWAKIILIAFGTVVTLIGLALLGFYIFANSLISAPIKVSDDFVNAFQSNDASYAYSLTSAEFKLFTKEERLKSIFEQVSPQIQGEEKVSDKHLRIYNGVETATIIYSIPTDNDTSYIRVTLRERADKWEVREMFVSKEELKANPDQD